MTPIKKKQVQALQAYRHSFSDGTEAEREHLISTLLLLERAYKSAAYHHRKSSTWSRLLYLSSVAFLFSSLYVAGYGGNPLQVLSWNMFNYFASAWLALGVLSWMLRQHHSEWAKEATGAAARMTECLPADVRVLMPQ